ncbi:hypothetical protein B9Z55_011167 [Caenorhabditis nigoni]|uniref:Uncharacterized protein n=1 Tax=Caenorhabditis nigoni TaxID=1611254 RepID=A0A2G5UJH8_9PELO|nr:hypothetical protein B9Z55_011167 [Caenorhabditis nigoni]
MTAHKFLGSLNTIENNSEQVQTASIAEMASSTSNIFHNTEERAMTAEEEEEKTAGGRKGPHEHPHSITAVSPPDGKSFTTLRGRYISRRLLEFIGDHDNNSADDETATEKEVRYMSGTTRPLKALPLPEGWAEWRRLQKIYARYPPSHRTAVQYNYSHFLCTIL